MRIVAFSDSHTRHAEVEIPPGDLLIFAGDLSQCRSVEEAVNFNDFLATLPHPYKVVIGGNHDHQLAQGVEQARCLLSNGIYLQDQAVAINGITLYGAPWQPIFNSRACDAFARFRGRPMREKWNLIPQKIDILITHTPPQGIMDLDQGIANGCSDLLAAVQQVRPRYHIFGHIHNHNGCLTCGPTTFINCNVKGPGGLLRPATVFDIEPAAVS